MNVQNIGEVNTTHRVTKLKNYKRIRFELLCLSFRIEYLGKSCKHGGPPAALATGKDQKI